MTEIFEFLLDHPIILVGIVFLIIVELVDYRKEKIRERNKWMVMGEK